MIRWDIQSIDERVLEIEATYSIDQEEYDLQIIEDLKDNHEKEYEFLKNDLPEEYPESWEGNFIKIQKLDEGTGAGYNLFHWFRTKIPMLQYLMNNTK